MKTRVLLSVVAAAACGLLGCGTGVQSPATTPQVSSTEEAPSTTSSSPEGTGKPTEVPVGITTAVPPQSASPPSTSTSPSTSATPSPSLPAVRVVTTTPASPLTPAGITPVPKAEKAVLPWIPDRAVTLMPIVIGALDTYWPELEMRAYVPAQIEKETCYHLKHSKCWSSEAALKTSREYGFGLGQFTVAYRSDGSVRFNAWEDVKKQHVDLKGWEWADRLNPVLQIKAIVIKNSVTWRRTLWAPDPMNRLSFVASEYNGGSTYKDRTLCKSTPRCDPTRWFKQPGKLAVADVSTKSKTPVKGYGKSFYDVNREYVVNVVLTRPEKYIPYVGGVSYASSSF